MLISDADRLQPELKSAIVFDPMVGLPEDSVLDVIVLMSQYRASRQDNSFRESYPETLIQEAKSTCVCIIAEKELVGIATEQDIVNLIAQGVDLRQIKLRDIMSLSTISLKASECTHLDVAFRKLEIHRIQHVPIVNDQNQFIGLVTPETLGLAVESLNLLKQQTVAEVMTPPVVASPATSLFAIAQMMAQHQVDCVVITETRDFERPCALTSSLGVLTAHDIVRFQALGLDLAAHQAQDYVGDPLHTVGCRDSLWSVQQRMQKTGVSRSVVVGNEGEVLGLVTQRRMWQVMYSLELCHRNNVLEQKILELEAEKATLLKAQIANPVQAQRCEHQIAEARLRESERRYVSLAAAAPVGIFRTDANGDYLYVNERWSLITGLCQPQALGKGWWVSIHPDDREIFWTEWQKVFTRQDSFQLEYRLRRVDGTVIWVYGQALAELDGDGRATGYVGTITDITIRKQTELTLNTLVEGTAAVTGQDFFPAMVCHIAEALDVRYVIVGQLLDEQLHVLASWADGHFQELCSYSLNHSPCKQTLKMGQYYCGSQLQQEFPQSEMLTEMGVESYFGIALKNAEGESIGVLCILDKKPLLYPKQTEKLLQVFAARAAAELERKSATDALRHLNQSLETRVELRTRELQEREVQLQDFFENANDLIQSVRIADGSFEYVNRAWRRTLGYTESEIQGLTLFDVLHPDCHEIFKLTLAEIQQNGTLFERRIELTFLNKRSQEVLVEGGIDFRFEGDRPVAQRAIFRDITDRKRHEQALRESQQLLQTVLDAFPLYVYWKNRESVYMGCNQNFAKAAGFSMPSEIKGKTDFDLPWAKMEAELYQADDRQIMISNQGKLGRVDTQIQANGQQRWIETNKVPLRNFQGEVMGVLGTFHDISDRKQAEQAIKQHSAAIEAVVDGIAILKDNRYLYLNQAHISLLGYNHIDELRGQHWNIQYQPEQVQWFESKIFPQLQGEHFWRGETIACRRDGSRFTQELSLTLTEEGLMICVCRDVTERKEYEAQLHQKNLELARATRLKDEFLANMSHELRTPLNAILGMSEAMQEGTFGEINDQQHKALTTVERSGNHLLELINDILDLSKIEAGQVELNLETTSVQPLCQASLAFVKQQALKKQIRLHFDLASPLPNITVDQRRLRQILINLLNNAVKFTPEGGLISLSVTMELLNDEGESKANLKSDWVMRFSISDTGIGISKADQAKLFKPFIQVDSALNRKYAGTGLGLSLVRRIVELHGGQISVFSEEGVGSTFIVDLPCIDYRVSQALDPVDSQSQNPITILKSNRPCTQRTPLILLAEDNDANIMTLSSYLKAKGYRLNIAKNGRQAIDQIRVEPPDLILMDIQMPEMDGLEAIQKIRQNSATHQIPIIALTALAMAGDRERCLHAGANDYITKPVQLKQLAMKLESFFASGEDP